jgi:hypothetical protein
VCSHRQDAQGKTFYHVVWEDSWVTESQLTKHALEGYRRRQQQPTERRQECSSLLELD